MLWMCPTCLWWPSCELAHDGLVERVQLICPFVQRGVASPAPLLVVQLQQLVHLVDSPVDCAEKETEIKSALKTQTLQ